MVAPVAEPPVETDRAVPPAPRPWIRTVDRVALAGLAAVAVVVRFLTRSPLWLDEALSVNIARLALGQITEALRHDGHPPLYYWLLHGWISVFGDSNVAVRSLSGLFGLALFPLVWMAGKRLAGRREAWAAVIVLALNPFAVRYSTETRMYSMVMVLALAAWLLADDALRRPTPLRLVGLAVCTGLALLSHYWVMWLVAAVGLLLLASAVRAHRRGDREHRRRATAVLAALAGGGLLFVPWLGVLAYQSTHTGTPWAGPVRPAQLVATTFIDVAGGQTGESLLLALSMFTLVVLGLFGRPVDGRRIEINLSVRPEARRLAATVAVTLAIAQVVAYATTSAIASRYIAPVFPMLILLVGMGVSRFAGGWWFRLVLAGVVALSAVGVLTNITKARTQAAEVARAVERTGTTADGVVAYCPDQLGPAVSRLLPSSYEQVTYPRFAAPDRVDWVDYEDELAKVDPADFAGALVERAGDRDIFLVWEPGYRTHSGTCEAVINGVLAKRGGGEVLEPDPAFFEKAGLYRFPAPSGPAG